MTYESRDFDPGFFHAGKLDSLSPWVAGGIAYELKSPPSSFSPRGEGAARRMRGCPPRPPKFMNSNR